MAALVRGRAIERRGRLIAGLALLACWLGAPGTAQAQTVSGQYLGNAVDNRAILGAGFQPDVVIIKGDTGQPAVIRTATMTGDSTKEMDGSTALVPNEIQSLVSNGFTVGTDASARV